MTAAACGRGLLDQHVGMLEAQVPKHASHMLVEERASPKGEHASRDPSHFLDAELR